MGLMIKIPRGRIYFSPRVFYKAVSAVLSGRILDGDSIAKFESRFAEYIGVKHAILTSSGKLSLYLCLKALGVEVDDEIILPSYTVPEVVTMIRCCGTKPVFVDIDPATYNINPELIKEKITDKTKIILLTHIYGQPCNIDPILKVARKNNLKIIEDVAQACGAEFKGRKTGSFGDLSYFSFGLMKNLNTLGGGMITTNDDLLADKIRKEITNFKYPKRRDLIRRIILALTLSFFTHPIPFSIFVFPFIYLLSLTQKNLLYGLLRGRKLSYPITRTLPEKYKIKFTNLQAAIGLQQLKELDENNNKRIENAKTLTNLLDKWVPIRLPHSLPYVKNIYLNYVIQVKDRDKVIKKLLRQGVDTTSGYIENCANLKEFQEFKARCPVSDTLSRDNLYLPIQPPLKERYMLHIAKSLKENLNNE